MSPGCERQSAVKQADSPSGGQSALRAPSLLLSGSASASKKVGGLVQIPQMSLGILWWRCLDVRCSAGLLFAVRCCALVAKKGDLLGPVGGVKHCAVLVGVNADKHLLIVNLKDGGDTVWGSLGGL